MLIVIMIMMYYTLYIYALNFITDASRVKFTYICIVDDETNALYHRQIWLA
jgi:hypothetical protein